jgi:hypothetical protein
MALIVVNCNVSPLFFLDEMSAEMVDAFIEAYNQNYRDKWYQTRFIAYTTANFAGKQMKDNININQFMPFEWEHELIESADAGAWITKQPTTVAEAEAERLRVAKAFGIESEDEELERRRKEIIHEYQVFKN